MVRGIEIEVAVSSAYLRQLENNYQQILVRWDQDQQAALQVFDSPLSGLSVTPASLSNDLTKGTQDKDFSYSFSDSLSATDHSYLLL